MLELIKEKVLRVMILIIHHTVENFVELPQQMVVVAETFGTAEVAVAEMQVLQHGQDKETLITQLLAGLLHGI